MVSSSAMAMRIMSRPSMDLPMVQTLARGDASAMAFMYAWIWWAYVSSPGVPTMWPLNFKGVGTVAEAGR